MTDPIPHAVLTDTSTVREAVLLQECLEGVIDDGPERDEHAILIATARTFLDSCEYAEIDPFDALAQIWDAIESGYLDGEDDPAQGRLVHLEHNTKN